MTETSLAGRAASAPSSTSSSPQRVKAPLAGVIGGLVLVGALGAWTFTRIASAKQSQAAVAERRAADAERAASLAKLPEQVKVVVGNAAKWLPSVELDGTLDAQQSASLGFNVGGKISALRVKVGDHVPARGLVR